jgi:uncharacterized BrkB/YihY/UPF0761 family membrane protein
MDKDWSTDPPPTAPPPQNPRSVAAMWMFGVLFFVLVIIPIGLVIYILFDALGSLGPSTPGEKPGIQAVLVGLSALAVGVAGVFVLQWFLLKMVFAKLTAEGETSSPDSMTEDEPVGPPSKPG